MVIKSIHAAPAGLAVMTCYLIFWIYLAQWQSKPKRERATRSDGPRWSPPHTATDAVRRFAVVAVQIVSGDLLILLLPVCHYALQM